jgi:hypothetical protein
VDCSIPAAGHLVQRLCSVKHGYDGILRVRNMPDFAALTAMLGQFMPRATVVDINSHVNGAAL